jgi:hypothetical protein
MFNRSTQLCVLFATVALVMPARGASLFVAAGQPLQPALDQAQPGDTITLQAGATFTGNFVLPAKPASRQPITIQSSMMSSLPAAGKRVSPAHAPYMAKIVSPGNVAAISFGKAAANYRIMGLEITVAPGIYSNGVVTVGTGYETSVADLPSNILLDRLYIHGDKYTGGKRGVAMNARSVTVKGSYISDFKSTWQDAQAVCGWNGPGPFVIENNYLEASGENILFGGTPPTVPNNVPADIVIRRNHLYKPLSWRIGDPTYAGVPWLVKNLLELKCSRRVVIDGNVMEYSWVHGQVGFAVLLTLKTNGGSCAVLEDIAVTRNIIRHAAGAFNILGHENGVGTGQRILIRDNIIEDINDAKWGGGYGNLAHIAKLASLTFEHNTVFSSRGNIYFYDRPSSGFIYRNNIASEVIYMVCGEAAGCGNGSLATWAPGAVIAKNVFSGAPATSYPVDNFYPATVYDAQFVDPFASNYALQPTSPYKNAGTDMKDLGADIAAVTAATAGVVQ